MAFPGSPMMPPPGAMRGPGPSPAELMGGDTSQKLMALSRGGRQVSGDLVRKIIDDLETLREIDPKLATNASMAIHVLKNGTEKLEQFSQEER